MMRTRQVVLAVSVVLLLMPSVAFTQPYEVERDSWHFDNFNTDPLTWDIYRDTFIGVPPTRDPYSSFFDVVFYDNLYKSNLAKKGNCYGMSLLSLMMIKNVGHLGYCAPVNQYSGDLVGTPTTGPTDTGLTRIINEMHGHQVHTESLRFFLDLIARGKTRDGIFAWDQVQYYQLRDDPTLVSITKSLNPVDGGHTMVAYDAKMVSGKRRIFLYDPNRPWPIDSAWYVNGDNVIKIESNRDWSFEMSSGETWSGGPSSGGHITIIPISVAGPRNRLPTTLGLDAASAITQIFVFADGGGIRQVTNAQGKRLYRPGTFEVDTDPSTGMLNMSPWYPSDQQVRNEVTRQRFSFAQYFIHGDPGGALELELTHKRSEYRLLMFGLRGSLDVRASGGEMTDRLRVENIGLGTPSVVLRSREGRSYDVFLAQVTKPGERVREFHITDLKLPKDSSVKLAVTDNLSALSVTSPDADIVCELKFGRRTLYGEEALKPVKVVIKTGESRILRPKTWAELPWSKLEQRNNAISKSFGKGAIVN